MEGLAKLYDLQQLLLQETKLTKQLSLIQNDPKVSDCRNEVLNLEDILNNNKEKTNSLKRELKKQEDQASTIIKQRKDYEEKMYSGLVTNAKELEQIQKKIIQLQKEEIALEENILHLMLNLDEEQETENELVDKLTKEKNILLELETNYDKNVDMLRTAINKVENSISKTIPLIDNNLYGRFQTICQKRAGLGIVTIEEGVCGGCQVSLSAFILEKVWQRKEIAICESCGRILYAPNK